MLEVETGLEWSHRSAEDIMTALEVLVERLKK